MSKHKHRPARRFGAGLNYAVCACGAHLTETLSDGWQPVLPSSRAYLDALSLLVQEPPRVIDDEDEDVVAMRSAFVARHEARQPGHTAESALRAALATRKLPFGIERTGSLTAFTVELGNDTQIARIDVTAHGDYALHVRDYDGALSLPQQQSTYRGTLSYATDVAALVGTMVARGRKGGEV